MYITGLFHRFIKFLILHFLYYVVLKILTFDLGKPDTISTALSRKLLSNFHARLIPFPDCPVDIPNLNTVPDFIHIGSPVTAYKLPQIPGKSS